MLPLAGYRVLDLTSNISGPSATMILADLGADVVKLERPGLGDDARAMGPFLQGEGGYFLALNRNKRSLVLDLKQPEGQAIAQQLAAQSDVVVENFRYGTAERLGLGYEQLRAENPRLIYCSLSAFGEAGPDRDKPGYDALLQARTGIMSITGEPDGQPVRAGVSVLDVGSGMWAALAVVSALLVRERTGEGQRVGTSLFETGVLWMAYHLLYVQATGRDPERQGARHLAFAPYGTYTAKDGPLLIGISNDRLFERLCQALDHPEWVRDARFHHNAARLANRAALEELLNQRLADQPAAHWVARLEQAGVPVSLLQSPSELLRDPQARAIGALVDVRHPRAGTVHLPRLPLRLAGSGPLPMQAPPLLGQHSREVLRQAGLEDAVIDRLIETGVVEVNEHV